MDRSPVKLNLGCGAKLLPGFVNVDMPGNWADSKPDVECDLTQPLPFADDYADEAHAYHVLEHFYRWQAPVILKDWLRVLKPGGLLVLELPCLDKIVSLYAHALETGKAPSARLTIMGLYGDPGYKVEAMCHRWCYSEHELSEGLRLLGFVDVEVGEPLTHQPARDMRITARKPHGDDVQRSED